MNMKENYTAQELLSIRGSLNYLLFLFLTGLSAVVLQLFSGIDPKNAFVSLTATLIFVSFGMYIYFQRKLRKDPNIACWLVAFFTILIPIITKYNYAKTMDWTYATQSYHASAIGFTYLIIIQFLHKKKIFIFYGIVYFVNWIIFLIVAYKQGAVIHLYSYADGVLVKDGLLLTREVMFFMLGCILSYAAYRNISVITKYDEETIIQNDIIENQKNEIQVYADHLEEKVKDRTIELQAAMEELEASNDQLIDARDALWGEMQLAKKIQSVLLPVSPHMKGYEIKASQITADEVGGDYYDLIQVGGKDWLVIGDVSGHGVPAGLIMMMVQTAIHSVLKSNPSMPTYELLAIVNFALTENIKRLGESKYMTITVMAQVEDGLFNFAGLHQDIIYRADTKKIESVETQGIWLGLEDDIKDLLPVDSIRLKNNDIMILFTDGITEALDSSGNMFGQDKMTEYFITNGSNSAAAIHDGILNEIKNFVITDDVSLMVIKRL